MKKSMKFEEWKELVAKNRQALNSKSNIFNTEPESLTYAGSQNSPRYNPVKPIIDGHEYVDLGLPSGTLWATMNVGAEKETDYGLYFAWGETQGYTASQVGTDKQFSWDDYNHGTFHDITKYTKADGKTMLELEDDAANANWGGQWRMPTKEQCEELFNTTYVTNKWVTDYNDSGVNGRLFTSVSNGKTLFIPAAGYCDKGRVLEVDSIGWVFSSSLGSTYTSSAYKILFGSRGLPGVDTGTRYCGQSVRGVVVSTTE